MWFVLTALSVLYVAWDAFARNPELTVMKWGWLLVTLYIGPVGAALYTLACKEPRFLAGEHEAFITPRWKQALGSTIHCLAGDATGIIVAAAITMTLGLPMWLDVISEYIFGFAFGLLIFQALFVKDMLGGSYLVALRRSFMPEWLSMNAVMAGMDMGGGPARSGGHTMAPVDISQAPAAPADARGNQPLQPTVVAGVKEFQLTASIIRLDILPAVQVSAYTYNHRVPGPLIRVTAGDQVRVRVTNLLPEPTSVHWHGLVIPNAQDGAAGVTQPPIQPGETFTYEYIVPNTPDTYFYHTHVAADRQQALGLYGALIIDAPAVQPHYSQEYILALGEWRVTNGQTFPAMELDGMLPNFFTINGKSYPATETVKAKVGDRILFRFVGSGQFVHPMHIHGGPFEIVATDGYPLPEGAQVLKDTVNVGPGERYDIIWTARGPGKWLLHCHINHHTTNDGREDHGGGGLTMIIEVTP